MVSGEVAPVHEYPSEPGAAEQSTVPSCAHPAGVVAALQQ
jgi:hypothetical protein